VEEQRRLWVSKRLAKSQVEARNTRLGELSYVFLFELRASRLNNMIVILASG